ncbi:MAG: hypothetical protein ACE5G8_15620 [Anaerolineae bacterium]
MTTTRKIGLMLMLALLLTAGFAAVAQADACTAIYFDTTSGDDATGDGTQAKPFKTATRAMQEAAACTTAVSIYRNGRLWRQIPAPIPEAGGNPLAQSWLIGGAIVIAGLLIGGAVVLRRRVVPAGL